MKKFFGTDGIRCIVNQEPMTTETCLKIAKVTGYLLSHTNKYKRRVLISKDTRLSGYLFEPLLTVIAELVNLLFAILPANWAFVIVPVNELVG